MRTLALTVLACGAAAFIQTLGAQVTANVEMGISDVQYDGFLGSAAGSLSPSMRWEHPRGRGFVSARATYLQFQSGRHSLDGSVNGSWFTPLARHWRGELGAAAGGSDYANIASFSHAQTEARLHLMDSDHGGWLGVTIGRTAFRSSSRPAAVIATGVWLLRGDKTMFASIDRSFVGETVYTDLRTSGRWRGEKIVLEGIVGARVWSRGAGRGVFGEGSATLNLGAGVALVLSGGRYPTEAISGGIAGKYATLAVRLGTVPFRHAPAPTFIQPRQSRAADGVESSSPLLEIQRQKNDAVQLTLYAPGAATLEISGDFTDWRAVALSRSPDRMDFWTASFRIAPGIHRLNVRRDGGPWLAPAGTLHSTDDYDGEVGVFTLP